MNTVNLIGRITKEIEVKKTNSGKAVCNFCVAVDAGKDNTYFIDCVAWNKRAENIGKFFHKGSKIGLSGELTSRTWQDSNGNNRKAVEVNVISFDFCFTNDSRQVNDNNPANNDRTPQATNTGETSVLPFEV